MMGGRTDCRPIIGIGGDPSGSLPRTPPGMRVRIGWFDKLRSGETGYSQLVRPFQGQDGVEEHAAVSPPVPAIGCHPSRYVGVCTQCHQFPVDGLSALPLFELDGSHAVAQPLVQVFEDPWCLRRPEVGFPAQNTGSQALCYLLHAAPAGAAGQLPDALLERPQSLGSHLALDHTGWGHPEGEAQEAAVWSISRPSTPTAPLLVRTRFHARCRFSRAKTASSSPGPVSSAS